MEDIQSKLQRLSEIITEAKQICDDLESYKSDIKIKLDPLALMPIEMLNVQKTTLTRFINVLHFEEAFRDAKPIKTIGELINTPKSDLARYHNMGVITLNRISKALKEQFDINW